MKLIEGEAPMFEKLEIFRMAHAMATHAGARQTVVSQNIANADTPGYRAKDVASFAEQFAPSAGEGAQRATRAGHLNGAEGPYQVAMIRSDEGANPNGNTVSVEEEMMKAVEVQRQHDRALAIYKSSLGLLRTSIGRR
ncbi:flagellar basal body rod protein FlgB [Litorivita pollutaquae]|uniref:Flagellar basal body rod protein FlgB n=2 Tax=Litorivita pollutaquae TaxID=2200892 RepID=A0A2V4NB55_9RHOB|nr:flagellar basal body rod protein FlgB [Litorivita pollutaquae]